MSDALDVVRKICRDISKRIDRKYLAECGRNRTRPMKLWNIWAETGLLGLTLPEEYGGIGGDLSDLVHAIDWLAQDGITLSMVVPNFMSRLPLMKYGTDEQRKRFLPATASGESSFSFAITEPDAGTNTFKIRSTAIRQKDGTFRLTGTKHYITGFAEADHCMVVARTQPYDADDRTRGLTLFLIDPKVAGVSSTVMDIGVMLAEKNYVVHFDDVKLTSDSVVGEEGAGLQIIFHGLNSERLMVSAKNVGQADYVLARAATYANARAPFDAPIGSYQSVQHPMAAAKVTAEGARALTYAAASAYDRGERVGLQSNMAKYLSAQSFSMAANASANVYGGGFADLETDIIPFYLQAKLNEIAPVNNNIVLSQIAQSALGLPKSY